MKNKIVIVLIILFFAIIVYAVDVKWDAVPENIAVADDDVMLLIDTGTNTSQRITVLNLFDTINSLAELNTIVGVTLVSEESTPTLDALWTFDLGLTITTGDPFILGVIRWDNGSDLIDGERIADDTIDNDSIDWGDMTDLTTDGALDADVVDEAHIADNGIDSEHYNDGSIDYAHLADDVISGAAAVGTFESGDTFLVLEAGVGLREADFDDLPSGGTMDSFFAEDGDGTEVEIDDAKEWKFIEGASIDIDWTDTSTGDDADPFDLTIKLVVADDESTDDNHEVVFTTDNATLESDGDYHYNPNSGTLTSPEFAGGGGSLTGIDAATGDSATAFFDAGTIEHEYGGLQADISSYTGLIAITGADTTAEIDDLSELTGQLADVTAFITDDDMPAVGNDPDVDAAGEIGRDSNAAGATGDASLRGYDGAAQYLYTRKIKDITVPIVSPDEINVWTGRVNPSQPVWFNKSGMTFTITEVYSISDTDNYDYTLFESASATDMSDDNDTSIVAVLIEDNGTECFTSSDTAINHAVETGHAIIFEDTDGSAESIIITISGWFDSDVN